jgi:hypothetical protein
MVTMMKTRKISLMPNNAAFVFLVLPIIAGSLLIPASYLAYAHTFSSSESADFLSLVEQIKAETALVSMNLENNNVTLAQTHVEKASSLLTNSTLDEIWEVNTRIADSLETGLEQLEQNIMSLASSTPQGQLPQDRIQSANQTVTSINDLLAEAVTVRIESEQRNNATTWAYALADLVNAVLSDYGNATGSSFDLTNMSNLEANSTSSSISNMTTNIVDEAAYQSAQYISNNTILQLFTETLKPLTLSANGTSSETDSAASPENSTVMTEEEQQTSTGNLTSNIDELEARLLLLRDNIANKATPTEVMRTAHLQIHPLLMQMYLLTMASPQ